MVTSQETLADTFAALGHPKRVGIFECLLTRAISGVSFGVLQTATGIPASTLTHHLREMEKGGILTREVVGRSTHLKLDLASLQQALSHLMNQCCRAEKDNPQ